MGYTGKSNLDFLITNKANQSAIRQTAKKSNDKCDKYDYLVSVGTGAIAGLVDVFLVGAPTTNKEDRSFLLEWSDKQVDNTIMKFAKLLGWDKNGNVKSAIGFLERKFKVNYDQRHSGDINNLFKMRTKDHHLKSLSHSPDIIGLFFSIVNQFASTSSFVTDGQMITINTDTYELQGSNLISKLFSAFINWFSHIMSDVGGSSGAGERGSGIAIPFYSLTQLMNVGKYDVGKNKQTIAEIANRAFQEGYDFRHGIAMTVPVLLTELIIRFFWSLRRYFQFEYTLKESIPRLNKNQSLRTMLIFGHGTLSVMDGMEAGIKSGGNTLIFFKNLNIIAWLRLSTLVVKEILIQLNLNYSYDSTHEIYLELNDEITSQLEYLEKIDYSKFEKEIYHYDRVLSIVKENLTSEEFNHELHNIYSELSLDLPWEGIFEEFMSSRNNKLEFRKNERKK